MAGETIIQSTTFYAAQEKDWLNTPSRLTIFVGKNGSGKSRTLRSIAMSSLRRGKDTIAIANTPYHAFGGSAGKLQKLLAGQAASSPEKVLKRAISYAETHEHVALRRIARVFSYCGYSPDIGILVSIAPSNKRDVRSIKNLESVGIESRDEILSLAELLVRGTLPSKPVWYDFDSLNPDYSHRSLLPRVIRWEHQLKRAGIISSIKLFLRRGEEDIPLSKASSGELSIITTSAFLAAASANLDTILIDEPENSLHPKWQREYIDLLLNTLKYRGARIFIATHSPLIVSEISSPNATELGNSVVVLDPNPQSQPQSHEVSSAIDAIMLDIFEVLTPRSRHFSEVLVGLLDSLDRGDIDIAKLNSELRFFQGSGADSRQAAAIDAARSMAHKIINARD